MAKHRRNVKRVDWPIGTKVRMVNCFEASIYKEKVWITRSEPWMMCGSQVVLLKGKSGGFDTSCLEVVPEGAATNAV